MTRSPYRRLHELTARGIRHPRAPIGSEWTPLHVDETANLFDLALQVASHPMPAEFDGTPFNEHRLLGCRTRLESLLEPMERIERAEGPGKNWSDLALNAALTVEPFLSKLLGLLDPQALLEQCRGGRPVTLPVLVEILSRIDRSPFDRRIVFGNVSFESEKGWEQRDSLSNVLRDLMGDRIFQAHSAPSYDSSEAQRVARCALVAVLSAVDRNLLDLERRLPRVEPRARSSDALDSFDGPPPDRRVDPDVLATWTSRAAERSHWLEQLRGALASNKGAVLAIQGPPGWGKSDFLMASLSGCGARVRVCDLADLPDLRSAAAVLLNGLEVTPDEADQLDRRDTALQCARILRTRLGPGPCVVVIENCQACDPTLLVQLPTLVKRLQSQGFVVCTESWAAVAGVEFSDAIEPRPIQREELEAWARRVLGRPPGGALVSSLELVLGNPALVGSALREVRELPPDASQETLDDQVLGICDIPLASTGSWGRYLEAATGTAPSQLDDPALLVFALLPWSPLPADRLSATSTALLTRLHRAGIVRKLEGAGGGVWVSRPAMRVLTGHGLWRAKRMVAAAVELAVHAAARTSEDQVERSIRHLAALASRAVLAGTELTRLHTALPQPALLVREDRYEPPMPVPESGVEVESFPPEIQLAVAESMFRQLPEGEARESAMAVVDEPAGSDAWKRWSFVKMVHRSILRSSDPAQRLASYVRVERALATPTTPGLTYWTARLLTYAAEEAAAARDGERCSRWLSRARELEGQLAPDGEEETWLPRRDLRYRVEWCGRHVGGSRGDLAGCHARCFALAASTLNRVGALSAAQWTRRLVLHAGALNDLDEWSDALQAELVAGLRSMGLDLGSARLLERIAAMASGSESVTGAVRHLALDLEVRARRVHRPVLAMQFGIVGAPDKRIGEAIEMLRQGLEAESQNDEDAVDLLALASLTFGAMWRDPRIVPRSTRALQDLGRKVLDVAARHALDPRELQMLQERVLGFSAARLVGDLGREVYAVTSGEAVPIPPQELERRVERVKRSMDKGYVTELGRGSPWLAVRWTQQRLELVGQWGSWTRRLVHHRDIGPVTEEGLQELLVAQKKLLGDAPATLLSRYLVARRMWRWEDAFSAFSAFVDCDVGSSGRQYMYDAALMDLLPLILTPWPFRSSFTPEEGQVKAWTELFLKVTENHDWADAGQRPRSMIPYARRMLLRADDPEAWRGFADACLQALGKPGEFWESVQSSLVDHPGELNGERVTLVQDLTDTRRLLLVRAMALSGSWVESLPIELRRDLAESAVAAAAGVLAWDRSLRESELPIDSWNLGLAVSSALILSEDGRIFGRRESHVARVKTSTPKPWAELALDRIDKTQGFGRFRLHMGEVATRVRGWFREAPWWGPVSSSR